MMEKQLILTLLLLKPKLLLFLTTSIQSVFQGKNKKSSVVDFFLIYIVKNKLPVVWPHQFINLRQNSFKISNFLLSLYFWANYLYDRQNKWKCRDLCPVSNKKSKVTIYQIFAFSKQDFDLPIFQTYTTNAILFGLKKQMI